MFLLYLLKGFYVNVNFFRCKMLLRFVIRFNWYEKTILSGKGVGALEDHE